MSLYLFFIFYFEIHYFYEPFSVWNLPIFICNRKFCCYLFHDTTVSFHATADPLSTKASLNSVLLILKPKDFFFLFVCIFQKARQWNSKKIKLMLRMKPVEKGRESG